MLIHGRLEHSDWLIQNLAKRGIQIRGARYGWDTFLNSSPCSYHQLSLHCSSNFKCDHPSITVDFCFQMRKLFISLAPRILRPDFTWPRTPRPAISETTPPVPHPPGRTVRLAFGKSFTMHYTIFFAIVLLMVRNPIWRPNCATTVWACDEMDGLDKHWGSCCHANSCSCWNTCPKIPKLWGASRWPL